MLDLWGGITKFGPYITMGAMVVWMLYRDRSPAQQVSDRIIDRLEKVEEKNDSLRKDINLQNKEIADLHRENEELKLKMTILESSNQSLPLPMWIKDVSGKMLSLNEAYEETFLAPLGLTSRDYIGHADADIWSVEVALRFGQHDNRVLVTKQPWKGIETVDDGLGGMVDYFVLKYPRMLGDTVVGISGIALSKDYFDEALASSS